MAREIRFQNTVKFNNCGCLPEAIAKSGLTLEQILNDINEEKEIENKVMNLHQEELSKETISKKLNLKLSKVKHIIKFDSLGLTYRKVGKSK